MVKGPNSVINPVIYRRQWAPVIALEQDSGFRVLILWFRVLILWLINGLGLRVLILGSRVLFLGCRGCTFGMETTVPAIFAWRQKPLFFNGFGPSGAENIDI